MTDDSKKLPTVIEHQTDPAVAITTDDAQFIRDAATRIRVRWSRSIQDVVDIGHDLIAVKERIGHGGFLAWIETEFTMGEQTARNMMNAAQAFGRSKILGDFNPTILYALSAPSTPPEVREEISKRAAAGQKISLKDVKQLKKDIAGHQQANAALTERADAADALIEQLRRKLDDPARMTDDPVEPPSQFHMQIIGAITTINTSSRQDDVLKTFWSNRSLYAGRAGVVIDLERAIEVLTALKAMKDEDRKRERERPRLSDCVPSAALLPPPSIEMPDIPGFLRRQPDVPASPSEPS